MKYYTIVVYVVAAAADDGDDYEDDNDDDDNDDNDDDDLSNLRESKGVWNLPCVQVYSYCRILFSCILCTKAWFMKIIKITERIGNILTTIDVTVDDVA